MKYQVIKKFMVSILGSHVFGTRSATEGNQRKNPMRNGIAFNRLQPIRLSVSNLSGVVAACCIIAGFAQQGIAQDATLTGVWVHSRDAKEQAKRYEAIDQSTKDMNDLFRGRARQMLRENTTPLLTINLIDGGERVTITRENRRVTFTTDGSPTRVESERGAVTLRAKRQNGQLVVTSEARNAVQTTVYSVSEDRTRLVLDISISNGRLKNPVRYQATYHRESK